MQLKSITLHGFKSFADATTFPVNSSLTGIIGPNGCGKSNIIDAVRWVLGENTAKHLRAGSGSDVIFGGAAKRRASHFAQVSLHFDNSDGTATGAFSVFNDIVISRKIQNDGQSTYFINQKVVRRRDIIELLQGAGVGARSYAVIEQGMIGRIIDAKPEELRSFIEEAAGIALYKNRRRESEKRMEDTEQYLQLHEERLSGLAKQRDALYQQAAVAREYLALKTEHQHSQHRLRSYQYHQQSQALAELSQAEQQEQSALAEDILSDSIEALQQAQSALTEAQHQRQQQQNHWQQLRQQQQQQQTQWHTAQTHQQHQQARAQEYAQRLNRLHEQLQHNHDSQQAQQSALHELSATIAHEEPLLQQARAQLQQQQQTVQEQQQQYLAQQQKQQHLAQQLQQQQQQAQSLRQHLHTWQERLHQLTQSALPAAPTFDEARLYEAEHAEQRAEHAWQHATAAEQHAKEQLQLAQQQHQHAQQQQQRLHHQIEVLQQTLPRLPEGDTLQPLPLVFEALHIAPLWQDALSRYLAPVLNAPCGDDVQAWQSALHHEHSYSSHGTIPPAWQGIVQGTVDLHLWLAHLTPLDKHNHEIRAHELDPHTVYLTLDGTLLTQHSVQPQALAPQALLGQQLQRLQAQLPEYEQQLQQCEEQVFAAQSAFAHAQSQRQQHEATWQHNQQSCARLRHEHALWQQALTHHQTLLAQQQHSQSALQDDIDRAQEDYALVQLRLEELQQQQESLHELTFDPTNLHEQQSALQAQTQAFHAAEQAQQQRQQQLAREQALWEATQKQHAQWQAESALLQEEQAQLQHQREEQQLQLEELSLALEESALAIEQAQAQLNHTQTQEHERAEQVRQLERQQQEYASAQQLRQERLKHLQQQQQLLREQQSALRAEMEDEQRPPLTFLADEQVDTQALQQTVRRLSQAMEALGAVNLGAVQAYADITTEHDTLEQQCLDLRHGLQLLRNAIHTLDHETRLRLKSTLEQVNHHFGALFPRLFNGGEAFLSWEAGDILEAGVSITVRPPGKKLKNIQALSGGEKALSALALVFALFRLNPAPFCLLDEVDAPLDEANVGRLCALLQEMAQETQFVVITHHKKTMQHCQRLIGVTMSEPGVSRLVAVEVNRAS